MISGAGTLGLGMVTYARMKNLAKLIVLDMIDKRLEKAEEFGADVVMNPGKENVVKKVLEMTDGYANTLCVLQSGICILLYFFQKWVSKKGGLDDE